MQPGEDVEVEEVHRAEDQQDDSDLAADRLENAFDGFRSGFEPQKQGDESDVDQIKAHHQKVVDRIGQILPAAECAEKKGPAIAVQGPGHPDGHANTEKEIDGVGDYGWCHGDVGFGLYLSNFQEKLKVSWKKSQKILRTRGMILFFSAEAILPITWPAISTKSCRAETC